MILPARPAEITQESAAARSQISRALVLFIGINTHHSKQGQTYSKTENISSVSLKTVCRVWTTEYISIPPGQDASQSQYSPALTGTQLYYWVARGNYDKSVLLKDTSAMTDQARIQTHQVQYLLVIPILFKNSLLFNIFLSSAFLCAL